MWLVKKAASKVSQISEKVLREDSEAEKMIKDIISSKHEVFPVKKMAQLATLTYDMQNFEKAVVFLKQKLNDIKMERKSLKKRLNLLILVSYLLKHGAGGFIDEFRSMEDIFRKYEIIAITENQEDQQLYSLLLDLSQRANYIKTLLVDKSALAREKELARRVKEKIMIQGGDYSRQNKGSISSKVQQQKEEKVQSFLEHYVWRYTSKLDKKIDQITDVLITKIDEYLDGQIPQSFEIDEIQVDSNKQHQNNGGDVKQKIVQAEQQYIQSKVHIQQKPQNFNLIDIDLPNSSRNTPEIEVNLNNSFNFKLESPAQVQEQGDLLLIKPTNKTDKEERVQQREDVLKQRKDQKNMEREQMKLDSL